MASSHQNAGVNADVESGAAADVDAFSSKQAQWKIWPRYVEEAGNRDYRLTAKWAQDIDILLVFAGLFSAIATTMLSQNAMGNLSPSYEQYAVAIALQQLQGGDSVLITPNCSNYEVESPFNPACFQVAWNDRLVNALWTACLIFSLSAALLAMLAKVWIREYTSGLALLPRDQARQRQYRYEGAQRWNLPAVLDSLMVLLHISVFLFFAGLSVFIQELDTLIFRVTSGLSFASFVAYVAAAVLPLLFPDCPFRFPPVKDSLLWMWKKVSKRRSSEVSLHASERMAIEKDSFSLQATAFVALLELSKEEVLTPDGLQILSEMVWHTEQRIALLEAGLLRILYLGLLCCESAAPRLPAILTAIAIVWESQELAGGAPQPSTEVDPVELNLLRQVVERVVDLFNTSSDERATDCVMYPLSYLNVHRPKLEVWRFLRQLSIRKLATSLPVLARGKGRRPVRVLTTILQELLSRKHLTTSLGKDLAVIAEWVSKFDVHGDHEDVELLLCQVVHFFEQNAQNTTFQDWMQSNMALLVTHYERTFNNLLDNFGQKLPTPPRILREMRKFASYLLSFGWTNHSQASEPEMKRWSVQLFTHISQVVYAADEQEDVNPLDLLNQLWRLPQLQPNWNSHERCTMVLAIGQYLHRSQNPLPRDAVCEELYEQMSSAFSRSRTRSRQCAAVLRVLHLAGRRMAVSTDSDAREGQDALELELEQARAELVSVCTKASVGGDDGASHDDGGWWYEEFEDSEAAPVEEASGSSLKDAAQAPSFYYDMTANTSGTRNTLGGDGNEEGDRHLRAEPPEGMEPVPGDSLVSKSSHGNQDMEKESKNAASPEDLEEREWQQLLEAEHMTPN